jgi:protein-tyrosine-phosphatase
MDITTDATLNEVLRAAAYPLDELVPDGFHASIADQFDAVLHFDETHAVEPLKRSAEWEADEVPETFPFAV